MSQGFPPVAAGQPVAQTLREQHISGFDQPILQRLIMALANDFRLVLEQDESPFTGKPLQQRRQAVFQKHIPVAGWPQNMV